MLSVSKYSTIRSMDCLWLFSRRFIYARLIPYCCQNWCAYCWHDDENRVTGLGFQLTPIPQQWLKRNWGTVSIFLYRAWPTQYFHQRTISHLVFSSLGMKFRERMRIEIYETSSDTVLIYLFVLEINTDLQIFKYRSSNLQMIDEPLFWKEKYQNDW